MAALRRTPAAGAAARPPAVEGATPLALVGVGRFAEVWSAVEHRLGRTVALKVMVPLPTGVPDAVLRALRELVPLTRVPGLGALHDVTSTEDGRIVLVAEPLVGGSTAELEEEGRALTVLDVVHLGKRLAGALHAVHRVGRLHLDIRPANVLLDRWQRPQLVDVGVDQVWARAHGLPRAADPPGVLAYCPPELLRGDEPDVRTDVYGLAATMTGLLAGHGPHLDEVRDPVELASVILSGEIPDLRPRGLPDPLWELLHSAMQPDPAHRPPSAEDFGAYLSSFGRLTTRAAGGAVMPRLVPPAAPVGLSSRSGRSPDLLLGAAPAPPAGSAVPAPAPVREGSAASPHGVAPPVEGGPTVSSPAPPADLAQVRDSQDDVADLDAAPRGDARQTGRLDPVGLRRALARFLAPRPTTSAATAPPTAPRTDPQRTGEVDVADALAEAQAESGGATPTGVGEADALAPPRSDDVGVDGAPASPATSRHEDAAGDAPAPVPPRGPREPSRSSGSAPPDGPPEGDLEAPAVAAPSRRPSAAPSARPPAGPPPAPGRTAGTPSPPAAPPTPDSAGAVPLVGVPAQAQPPGSADPPGDVRVASPPPPAAAAGPPVGAHRGARPAGVSRADRTAEVPGPPPRMPGSPAAASPSRRRPPAGVAGGLVAVLVVAALLGVRLADRGGDVALVRGDPPARTEVPVTARPTPALTPTAAPAGPPAPTATPVTPAPERPTVTPPPAGASAAVGAGLPRDAGALVSPVDLLDTPDGLLVADVNDHRVHRLVDGALRPLLGTGLAGGGGDGGPAAEAQVSGPSGLALDADGRLLVAERLGDRVRVVDGDEVRTLVQLGGDSALRAPVAVAALPGGGVVLASTATDNVAVVDAEGQQPRVLLSAPAVANPSALAVADGQVVVLDAGRTGSATAAASAPQLLVADPGDGTTRPVAGLGPLAAPRDVWVGGGRVAVVDGRALVEARLDVATATASEVVRTPLGDLPSPFALTATAGGYAVADPSARRLVGVPAGGGVPVPLVPDAGATCDAGGAAADVVFRALDRVVATPAGTLLVADAATGCLLEVEGDRVVRALRPALPEGTVLGGLAVDDAGTVFLSDAVSSVYRLDGDVPVRIAGTGQRGRSTAAGPAEAFALAGPQGLDWHDGVLYVADSDNLRIVAVEGGLARPVVGAEPLDDRFVDGPADRATFAGPVDVLADERGLVVVDQANHAVRRVLWPDGAAVGGPGGVVDTVVGDGVAGRPGGAVASAARLTLPTAVSRAPDGGGLFVVDAGNGLLHRVDPAADRLRTVFGLDGAPASPRDVAVGPDGDVLVADRAGRRVWLLDDAGGEAAPGS